MNKKSGKSKKQSEKAMDKAALFEEDMSIFVAIGLTLFFIVIGICLGTILYKIAINSSAAIMYGNLLLK